MAESVTSLIHTPDGRTYRLSHPADATDEQIRGAAATFLKQAEPESQYGPGRVDRAKPESFAQGVLEGAEIPFNNAALLAESVAGLVGADKPISDAGRAMGMAGTVDEAMQSQRAFNESRDVQGSDLGRFAGEVVGTLPTAALPGGAFVQSAAAGALLTDERNPIGIAKDALVSGVTGLGASRALRAGANALVPPAARTNLPDSLQTLYDAGIRTTPGQYARASANPLVRATAAFEDRAAGQPIVGDIITAGRRRGVEDLGAAAINRSLEPIGEALPARLRSGRRAIQFAGDRLGAAYERVLPRIGRFQADDQFVSDLAAIQDDAAEMLPARAEQLRNILGGLNRFFSDGGTTLDGEALKSIETRLGQRIRRLSASQDADQQDLGAALESARSAVRELAGRAYPEQAEALTNINRGWASLVQAERASLNNRGAISPNSYSQAVKATNDTVRRRGYARGEALNQDLADAASDVLPSEVGDSGTSGRWAQANLLGLATGAAQAIPYAVTSLATRSARVPPPVRAPSLLDSRVAQLLQYGAQAAPALAPALINGGR